MLDLKLGIKSRILINNCTEFEFSIDWIGIYDGRNGTSVVSRSYQDNGSEVICDRAPKCSSSEAYQPGNPKIKLIVVLSFPFASCFDMIDKPCICCLKTAWVLTRRVFKS